MKKVYRFLAVLAIAAFLVGLTGCSAGRCGCPGKTFDIGQVHELE